MDKEQMKSEITKLIEKHNREKGKRYNKEATKKRLYTAFIRDTGLEYRRFK
jgi:hypothetical protein